MNNQSEIKKNVDINNPAPATDGKNESNTHQLAKDTTIRDSDAGEAFQFREKQEDNISEGDKMLLDYAYLTSLY